jgi:CDP-diacylglycerol--glycerol-3-phosphate 3-phosphatidyltransferase
MIMLVEANRLPAIIPVIVLFREFLVSGYRLVAVQKDGKVIAASIWGKLKTVTQMTGLIIALVDMNAFGRFISGGLTGFELVLNIASTLMLSISVIATIFSGINYMKDGKDLMK